MIGWPWAYGMPTPCPPGRTPGTPGAREKPRDRERGRTGQWRASAENMVHSLLDAVDPDVQTECAKQEFGVEYPSQEQLTQATEWLVKRPVRPSI